MDLRDALHALVAPLKLGDELAEGVVLRDLSVELGLRAHLEVHGAPLRIDIAPIETMSRWAAKTSRFGLAYRTEGGRLELDPKLAKSTTERLARVIAHNESCLELPASQSAQAMREVSVSRALESAGRGNERFYTLSPYVGCTIGCRFCYAQGPLVAHRRLLGLEQRQWGGWVDARINIAEVLTHEVSSLRRLPVKLCPVVSDPYQGPEKRFGLTRQSLQVLAQASWQALVLTRSELVLRDLELLASMDASVGVSISTADDNVRQRFEPRAASVQTRREVLSALRQAGVATFAVVQPMLPGDLGELVGLLSEHVDSVSIDVLRGIEDAQGDFDAYPGSAEGQWQLKRAIALRERLIDQGVVVWGGELPPHIQ